MTHEKRSILIISPSSALPAVVIEALQGMDVAEVTKQESSIAEMNGKAVSTILRHDLVVLDADPDDEGEMKALRDLLAQPRGGTKFLALTRSDLPLRQARLLTSMGVDQVLPLSISGSELNVEVRQRLVRPPILDDDLPIPLASAQLRKGGAVIAVAAARGGVGATSVAVNLAALLLDRRGVFKKTPRKKVVLVDFDLQFGNAGIFLDLEDRGAMLQIARSATPPDAEFVRTAVLEHSSGLHVLTAPTQPIPLDALRSENVGALLDCLRREYDYVVVDMPHALVMWLEPLLKCAGCLMLVTDTSVPAIRQCRRLIDIYTEDHLTLPIEIIINGEKRPFIRSAHQREAAKVLERPLNTWLPRDEKSMRSAVDRGEPVVSLAANSDLAKAYRQLAGKTVKTLPLWSDRGV